VPVDLESTFRAQRRAFEAEAFPDLNQRRAHLRALRAMVLTHRSRLVDAVRADFGTRPRAEIELSEIFAVLEAIKRSQRRLRRWMRPRRVGVSPYFQPARAEIRPVPRGVVGIVSPWNYPLNLSLSPLQSALAAGNRVLLKPSERTPATSQLLAELLESVFDPDRVAVVLGDAEVGARFARLPFDHLLFTGSTRVGRAVLRAAAENLVPATLELGGKCPALIAPDRRSPRMLRRDAEAIAFGKLLNAGQTCLAPDYVLVPEPAAADFRAAIADAIGRLYPRLFDNPDYGAVLGDDHRTRLATMVAEAKAAGCDVEVVNPGAEDLDAPSPKFPPTLVLDPPEALQMMREEIFGPILPIETYQTLDEALGRIVARPNPLAMYVFSRDSATVDRVLARARAGGVTVNDTIMHCVEERLPFGGLGESGMGAYHGRFGFETFSHLEPIFRRGSVNPNRMLRPPFGRWIELVLRIVLR
jgi:coniferyl-aldehyde dehydrogenase